MQDDIVAYLPDDPAHVLIQYGGLRNQVYKARVHGRPHHTVHQPAQPNILSWMATANGDVRVGSGLQGENTPVLIAKTPDGQWKDLSAQLEADPSFQVWGLEIDPDILLVTSSHHTDTSTLYRYNVSSNRFIDALFHHPTSDVLGVIQSMETGEVLGVRYGGQENVEVRWLSGSTTQAVGARLATRFPGLDVRVERLNQPGTHAVALVTSALQPGHYVVYDIQQDIVHALPPQYPNLADATLGNIVSISYTARDGLPIQGFLTLPPGLSEIAQADRLPVVVMPHGGPGARDFARFDCWSQFIASRGYMVFQMNFRGSTGLGERMETAGHRQWGQTMQDDITDGVHHLIEKGYADNERIAIVGASYGGYAALMGVAKTPDLYRCAVTHGAVTDLPALLEEMNNYIGGKYATRHIGRLWNDRQMLRENSPTTLAEQIDVPVLLFHGENDRVVSFAQSKRMVRALKRARKPYTFIAFAEGNHHLSNRANRLQFLSEMETFLAECMHTP